MADFLTVAKMDFTDLDSKVDLIGGTLQLQRGTWIPKSGAGAGAGGRIHETLGLISSAGDDAIMAELVRLERLFHNAENWRANVTQEQGSWLEWGIPAEPRDSAEEGYASKRAWIYNGQIEVRNVGGLPGALLDQRLVARVAIERAPFFENLQYLEFGGTSIGWGDLINLTGEKANMGSTDGRIRRALVYETTTAQYMTEFWLGLRRENAGVDNDSSQSYIKNLWELEDGTNGTDATDAVDATASGGDKVTVSFSTEAGLDTRSTITVYQSNGGAGNMQYMAGRWLVLLRCKVGSSTEVGIVMRAGGDNEYARPAAEEVYIDHTAWTLIELGEIQIPTQGYRSEFSGMDLAYACRHFAIQLDAERLSGSGSLDLDCLYLIPADHLIHVRYPDTPADVMMMEGNVFPDDSLNLHMWEVSNDTFLFPDHSAQNWIMPTDPVFGAVAGQKATGHVLTYDHNVYLRYYPRWLLYRTG